MTAKDLADISISMDADLQDDINVVDKFVDKYHEGCDIVYGVRSSRKKDTVFKRGTAGMFYKLMRLLGAVSYTHLALILTLDFVQRSCRSRFLLGCQLCTRHCAVTGNAEAVQP